ncbi:MAG: ion channel [Mariprofundaceae bacterium]
MSAAKHKWLGRSLDALLFISTLLAVGIGFWDESPEWASVAVLITFVLLFGWRWYISEDRTAYLKSNWFDLVLVVLLASPALRLLSAFRAVGLLPGLRIGALIRSNRKRLLKIVLVSQDSFPVAMVMVFGLVFVFGAGVYLIEHPHNPAFAHFEDGLWWAFVTLTTVGYGDIVPITAAGRIVAVLTMVFGIAVYSLMIANLTFFVEEQGRKRRLEEEAKVKVTTD